ncbi:hypothetical protein PMEL_200714 [Prevotella melaninogenica]|uniref:Uncharacterized protein n=1 Tax=Prevotella melaninogenica TaxID=28132 RepID=A0A250KKP5_9BACT|nr:hypothetical protein PMEL_200714 [Prevotella melaninogenica]
MYEFYLQKRFIQDSKHKLRIFRKIEKQGLPCEFWTLTICHTESQNEWRTTKYKAMVDTENTS